MEQKTSPNLRNTEDEQPLFLQYAYRKQGRNTIKIVNNFVKNLNKTSPKISSNKSQINLSVFF